MYIKIKRKLKLFSIMLFLTLLLCSCKKEKTFLEFTNEVFVDLIKDDGLMLHYTLAQPEKYGIKKYPATFGRIETDCKQSNKYIKNILKDMETYNYDKLSKEEKITYDCLYFYLNNNISKSNYILYEEYLNPGSGLHIQLPLVLSEYTFYSENDVINYLDLLQDYKKYFENIINFEKAKSKNGFFMNKALVLQTIQQCKDFAKSDLLETSFNERIDSLNIDSSQKSNYKTQNKKIIKETILPTYTLLIANLSNFTCSTNQLCNYNNGTTYYELLTKSLTGSSHSMEELSTMLDNKICNDIEKIYSLINKNPDILNEYLNNDYINNTSIKDTSLDIENETQLLTHLTKEMQIDFPNVNDVNYVVKHVSKSLEDYVSPAFFLIPPIDNFKNNVIYINKSVKYSNTPLFTSLAHEGFPGHLYQNTYFSEHNNYPIRNLIKNNGYLEGYASYITIFSYKYFDFSEDLCSFAQSNDSLSLCMSARADIGIHYEGWTKETLQSFFIEHDYSLDSETANYLFNLILSSPANYLQYAIGYLEICELENTAKTVLKDKFSYKDFHTFLLDIGPAPFDTITYWFYKDFLHIDCK